MTPQDFLSWLDQEIADATKFRKFEAEDAKMNYWLGATDALECVKRRFLTLQYPPQPIDPTIEEKTINPPGN